MERKGKDTSAILECIIILNVRVEIAMGEGMKEQIGDTA